VLDVEAFLLDCQDRNLSPNTLRIYSNNLAAFREWYHGQDPSVIRPRDVRAYLSSMQHNGHNPGGCHQAFRVLKTFFHWLVMDGDLEKSPMANVSAPKVPEQSLEPAPLNDLRAMLATCERRSFTGDRDRAILLALLGTGCRASEFVSLNMEDVNLSSGAVIVRQRKGGKRRVVGRRENGSDVLVDEDRVSVGVHQDETCRPGTALICLADQLHALLLQTAL